MGLQDITKTKISSITLLYHFYFIGLWSQSLKMNALDPDIATMFKNPNPKKVEVIVPAASDLLSGNKRPFLKPSWQNSPYASLARTLFQGCPLLQGR